MIKITLTRAEAEAIVCAITDCTMEGLPPEDVESNCAETWGDDWRHMRAAAMRIADRLTAALKKGRGRQ